MGNNKYIGNRYVPIILGNWDSSKNTAYESLSVVLWGGNSYTSTKNVPVGVDITDTNFWVKTGDYNAQVSILEDEVNQLTSDLNALDTTVNDALYQPPLLALTSVPTLTTYKHGQTVDSVTLNLAITKKWNDVQQLTYKRNGATIHTNSTPNNISDSYVDLTSVLDTTNFQVTAYDGKTNANSNLLTFNFVYQMFQGKVSSGVTTPNETQIKAMTEIIKTKQNITQAFTLSNEKIVFAYPSSYGVLTSILDANNFEILNSFTQQSLSMLLDDGTNQNYNVYVLNNPATVTNFNLTFKF